MNHDQPLVLALFFPSLPLLLKGQEGLGVLVSYLVTVGKAAKTAREVSWKTNSMGRLWIT